VSGAQAGFLDPAWNMFWGWSSGYIFFKLEGDFTSLSSAETLPYNMHIGGFSGPDQCIRKCALAFPKDLQIRKNRFAQIKIEAELDRLFDAVENIDLTSYNGVTIGKKAAAIASNYQKMFSVKEVSNQ
jgi:hypothetical protein